MNGTGTTGVELSALSRATDPLKKLLASFKKNSTEYQKIESNEIS